MKNILLFVLFSYAMLPLKAQYTTQHPFDSTWIENFSGKDFNIVDLGAIPNDSINDNKYFLQAADSIEKYNGGKLIIPAGVYIVGEQTINTIQDDEIGYYEEKEILEIHDVSNIIIEGEPGTVLKLDKNLRYGSFDPVTGAIYNAPAGGFTDPDYAVDAGTMICIRGCTNVSVSNIECDGNSDNLIIGGYWGDVGIQREASGVAFYQCSNVLARDIYTHHHGLDGFYISWWRLNEDDEPTPHIMENIVSEYNGRQGFSWVGGIGITAYNCKFNHTSQSNIASPPRAGVDIEAEESVCREGLFINCEFNNNKGPGLVADSGDGGYSRFENCTFWGTTSWSVWNTKPGMKFNGCKFHGSLVYAYGSADSTLATQYKNCHFEDLEYPPTGEVYRYDYLITFDIEQSTNIKFDNCTIVANKQKSLYLSSNIGSVTLKNTTVMHKSTTIPTKQNICLLNRVILDNTTFAEDFKSDFNRSYVISGDYIDVKNCVFVEGNVVKFYDWKRSTSGMSGWIKPGYYHDYVKDQLNIITSPANGETLETNNTSNIKWEIKNKGQNVAILLYKGCAFYKTIIGSTANDGEYSWFIDNNIVPDTSYSIKMVVNGSPSWFSFSNNFSISKSTSNKDLINQSGASVVISPNPAKTKISIHSENAIKEIKVFNILGQQQSMSGEELENIDISEWQKGLYFICIKTDKETVTKKLLKE